MERRERTLHGVAAELQHVRIDLRGLHVRVSQQFLYGADVVAALEQVRGKRMPQRVRTRALLDAGFAKRAAHATLDPRGRGYGRART